VLALPFLSASLPALRVPASRALLPFDAAAIFQVTSSAAAEAPSSSVLPRRAMNAPRTFDWRIWLMLIWAAGAAVPFARMFAAFIAMGRIRRTARPFRDEGLASALAHSLRIRHAVRVLESRPGSMPMTFGLWRPAVFMPPEAAEWSEELRRVVLLHELAHVRRGDTATHLLARTALSLNWWNPLAWSAWREFLKERERSTDDLVLNAGARASDYAGHLLEVARTMQSTPATAWAAVAMARRSQLEGRLLAILDSGVKRHAPGRVAALAAMLLAIAAVAPFAAMRAQTPAQQTTLAAARPEPETAAALLHLGIAIYGKDPAQALDYFERAQNVAPAGPIAGLAMTWQAMVRQQREGEAPAAESLYRAALAVEGVNSPDAALTLEFLAHFLREQGRVSEAEAMESSAGEIRKTHVAQLSPKRQTNAEASRIGAGVAPKLLYKLEPSYSDEARAAKVQGVVVLSVVVGTDGKTSDIQLRKGLGYGLDEQALNAITQWTFKPGMRDGMAVPVQASIEVNFRLL
jgi:TonB family protein